VGCFPRDAQRADVAEEAEHFLPASAKLTGMIPQHIFASQFSRSLDTYRSIGVTSHIDLLERTKMVFSQSGTFLSLLATA
jgi:hypothetical protein